MPILGTFAGASARGYGFTATSNSVTGGTLYTSGGYNYRVFTSNGTLTVSGASITADILVVAGGGGGGNAAAGSASGAGGAGGLLGFTSQSLSPAGYTVTIGAAGAGGGTGYTDGTVGGDSQFGSLTLVKGGGFGSNATSTAGGTGGSGYCRVTYWS